MMTDVVVNVRMYSSSNSSYSQLHCQPKHHSVTLSSNSDKSDQILIICSIRNNRNYRYCFTKCDKIRKTSMALGITATSADVTV